MSKFDPPADFASVVIFDLDGTLCNDDHRAIHAENKDWDAYHAALIDDEPNEAIADIARALASQGFTLYGCTGRPAKYHTQTVEWLVQHKIPLTDILMRPDGDFTSDHELKPAMIREAFGEEYPMIISCVFDDRERVVEAWREMGLVCLQVAEGKF